MKRIRSCSLAYAITLVMVPSLLALVTPATSKAQRVNTIKPTTPEKVTLTGVVRDPDGRALAAAEVIVGFSECGAVLVWTKPLEARRR